VRHPLACGVLCLSLAALAAAPALARNAAWNGLSPGDQAILRPVEKQWNDLPDEARARLLKLARRYPDLSPEQQARVRQRLADCDVRSGRRDADSRRGLAHRHAGCGAGGVVVCGIRRREGN
jgi:hypothetical protein